MLVFRTQCYEFETELRRLKVAVLVVRAENDRALERIISSLLLSTC